MEKRQKQEKTGDSNQDKTERETRIEQDQNKTKTRSDQNKTRPVLTS